MLGSRPSRANRYSMTLRRTTARGLLLTLIASCSVQGRRPRRPRRKVPTTRLPGPRRGDLHGRLRRPARPGRARGRTTSWRRDAPSPSPPRPGTVKFYTTSSRAGCMLYLDGKSGTEYLYIHLNNDLTTANDNQGKCVPGVAYAKGLKSGAKVAAGEPIGLRRRLGRRERDPSPSPLRGAPERRRGREPVPVPDKARRLLFSAQPGTTFTLALTGKVATAAGEDLQLTSTRSASGPAAARSSRPARRCRSPCRRPRRSKGSTPPPRLSPTPTLELLTKGLPVTVWTSPAKVTFGRAQTGAKGALAASRVVVKP